MTSAGHTAIVSEAIGGSAGFTKLGAGLLQITGANTFSGQLLVSAGILRLSGANAAALGATGAGNETIVTNGATLDFAGAYSGGNRAEDLVVSGNGVDGAGALVNTGGAHVNVGFRNLTLMGDTAIGGTTRLDLSSSGTFTGNGFTLTKTGLNDVAVSRAVNGSPIVILGGSYIVQNIDALGGATAGDTTIHGGYLANWGDRTLTEALEIHGGGYQENRPGGRSVLAGSLTLHSNMTFNSAATRTAVVAGVVSGPGGITNRNGGVLLFTTENSGYLGQTVNVGGSVLRVGDTGGTSGRLGPGDVVNDGNLFFDRSDALTVSNNFLGVGITHVRYGAALTMYGGLSTQLALRVASGSLNLSNGASLTASGDFTIASRMDSSYPVDPVSITGTVSIPAGCSLTANAIIIGNGVTTNGGSMVGVINQYGGTVRTTGSTAENNGIRLGHYPQGLGRYNMMGGTLVVDNGYDLGIATDGTGWVHQTGGEIFATTVMLNERANTLGRGRLTVEGGTLNVGAGGITRDAPGGYLVEYGGAGGVVRATASFTSPLDATLSGSGGNAVTFDTAEETITLSGALGGTGGLNKTGAGMLKLTGANSYAGATAVSNGTLEADGAYTGGGLITVHDGAVLAGTGMVASVTIAGNGTVAPGTSAGTLTVGGDLTLADASILDYELDAPDPVGGAGGDFIAGIQGLTLDGVLNVTSLGFDFLTANVGDQWKLMAYSGSLTDNTLSLGSMPGLNGGRSYAITVTGDSVILSVVPEPGALGLLGLVAVAWILRRRT